MSIKGIIFIALAVTGAMLNFSSKRISEKFSVSELKVKITALIIVVLSVILLFVFGK